MFSDQEGRRGSCRDVPIGISVYSGLGIATIPYLDRVVAPFESVWFPDHLQYGSSDVSEGWTSMVFALARYSSKLCGHQVLCNGFRSPTLLAKMAATAQSMSGGRLALGLGAGWNREEFLAYGWAFPEAQERIARLTEAIEVIRAMWDSLPATFTGDYYQAVDAYCSPTPTPPPPIMIGGAGERHLLKAVAQHADWWNYTFQDLREFARKQRILMQHCDDVGRDYDDITQVIACQLVIGETTADVHRMCNSKNVRSVVRNGIAGTPSVITEVLGAAIDQGARRITVGFADSPRTEGAELFSDTVLPSLSAL